MIWTAINRFVSYFIDYLLFCNEDPDQIQIGSDACGSISRMTILHIVSYQPSEAESLA